MRRRFEGAGDLFAALQDDNRREMYVYIRRQHRPVSREEAAVHAGISRKLAAWHLDRLVDCGLLTAHYARPPGRSGPGAGRPPKLYRPSDAEIEVTIPERRYDVVAEILLHALGGVDEEAAGPACRRAAYERGLAVGRAEHGADSGVSHLAVVAEVLAGYGFEPSEPGGGELSLHNCPFRALSDRAAGVVCPLNLEFVRGILGGMRATSVTAHPRTDRRGCCVVLHAASP